MKKLVFFFLAVVMAAPLFSQVSLYGKLTAEGITPGATFFISKKVTSDLNLTAFSLITKGWGEAMFGAAYSFSPNLQAGLNCGFEQLNGEVSFRTGASFWTGKGKTAFVFLGEKGDGDNNYWYKTTLSQKLSDQLGLGVRAWRFNGIGPLVEYQFKNAPKMWAFPAYNLENKKVCLIIGIDIKI